MNQEKIGKFIAELRKQQGLTQAQLGECLGVTNKTVSRWENSNYMPDLSLIPDLAAKLGVSVNELVAGERFAEEEYKRSADEQLLKNMQLLEEIREIKDSRWLSQGMGEVGVFMFIGLLLNFVCNFFGMEYSNSLVSIFMLLGLAVIIAGSILIIAVKRLQRLHFSTVLGLGFMIMVWGAGILAVFSPIMVGMGMLGNRIYFRAIDKLLDANMKMQD